MNPPLPRTLILALAVILSHRGQAIAQEAQDTTTLKELVVTANRLPTPANAVTASVTVITGEQLRSGGLRFVQDALRQLSGGQP